ncbi:MAG TPA: MFS transporter [Hyphomicrobiales bacterium]|nr:MFS transporter [Hyphomicrobiales bacterium]
MNRTKLVVAASTGLSVVATTLILPILAPLIRELGLSVSQGGLMVSIGSVVMVAAAPFWGTVSDRHGCKAVIVSGFLGVLVGYAIYTLVVIVGLSGGLTAATVFLALTASRAVVGVFLSAVPAGAQALMADSTTARDRAGGMAIIGAAMGLGLIAGPAVSGLLVTGGITWPLFAAIALCALGAAVALLFLKAAPVKAPVRARKASLFSLALQPWLVAGILLWIAIATVQISAGFYFQDRLGLDGGAAARMLSLALTLVGIGMFAVQFVQVRVLRLAPRILVLAGAGTWIAGLLLLLSAADPLSCYLAYALFGLGSGFLLPGVMAGASLAVGEDGQGVAAGLVSASQGIGFIIGPAASTTLYAWDKALPFWVLAGLMLLLALKFAIVPLLLPQFGAARSRAERAGRIGSHGHT